MINGTSLAPVRWHGLALVVNDTVPADGYVVTDAKNNILSGGNIRTGKSWLHREGEAAIVYAPKPVVQELIRTEHTLDPVKPRLN